MVLARFMPFIRTFAPIVAGAVRMPWRRFILFSLIGGLSWAIGLTTLGWGLGKLLGRMFDPKTMDRYFTVIVAFVILISVMPTVLHLWKEHRHEILARFGVTPRPREPGN